MERNLTEFGAVWRGDLGLVGWGGWAVGGRWRVDGVWWLLVGVRVVRR